jgi:membrane-bound lytic murein transglycosylase D
MKSTTGLRRAWAIALAACICATAVTRAFAADNPVPRPPQLERDVHFWIRVYTQIDTNSGFLHDQYNLAAVYDTLRFPSDTSPAEREKWVDAARDRYGAALRRIADAEGTPQRLRAAVDDIRFQLGQSDRFRDGLIRSGAWETHIAETLANLGLPAELAVLPHVESSFNPAAYSKVGAAGLWQFMRSTGRRYLRIDGAVDNRLDPFRSTEAAAQLLAYNYRVLGTWPLALTAYNHGSAGVRHAKETLGTDDIVTIVRNYHSRTFGFASRNFYVSFLAALEIDRDPGKYFGSLQKEPEARFQEVQLPAYVTVTALEHTLKIDGARLRALNPALLEAVWAGRQRIPRAYRLRLPMDGQHWSSELLAQRLGARELYAGQRAPPRYRVQRGDTLATVAERFGVSVPALAQLNRLRTSAPLHAGRVLTLPEATEPVTGVATLAANEAAPNAAAAATRPATPPAATPGTPAVRAPAPPAAALAALGGAVPAAVARRESAEEAAAVAEMLTVTVHGHAGGPQPVTAAQAEALGPALGPGTGVQQSADPTDYSVTKEGTIRVAAEETLGHYADWLDVPTANLRTLNHLKARRPVLIGERILLDLHKVPREAFEQRRHEYHRALQASYFASHRIVGTEIYIARAGDSPWTLTQRGAHLPLWLLQQYNPDVDLATLHPGVQLAMPRVEQVDSGG